jgi:hypothetical protein
MKCRPEGVEQRQDPEKPEDPRGRRLEAPHW